MVYINSQFSSGNIRRLDTSDMGSDFEKVILSIENDNQSEFKQWFHFRAHTQKQSRVTFSIVNAKDCSYPNAWEDYQVCCSYDGQDWFRIPTSYENGELHFELTFAFQSAYFAYFVPFSYERHQQLVSSAQLHSDVSHSVVTETLEGREINLLKIGNSSAANKVWVIARQHPGESMAEWFMEGLIARLLDSDDGLSRKILQESCFFLVPNMNPDGTERGHLRTNAAGVNLNREWLNPSEEKSPEVFAVRKAIEQSGATLFIDVHGDEALPYNFVAGCEGNPSYNEAIASREQAFISLFMKVSPEFQDSHGYTKDQPGQADLSVASSWVGEHLGCLSFTLEMPFKDNKALPNPRTGWSPERSRLLGESILYPIYHSLLNK